ARHRLFRIVLGIYGFILGALLASTMVGAGNAGSLVLAAIVGGLIGAIVLNFAYFLGVVLVGAAFGAMVAAMLWGRVGAGPHGLGGGRGVAEDVLGPGGPRAARADRDPVRGGRRSRRDAAAAVRHHHRDRLRRRMDSARGRPRARRRSRGATRGGGQGS